MKNTISLLLILIILSCSSKKNEDCKGKLIDLEVEHIDEEVSKILNYHTLNSFIEVKDSTQLVRFEESKRVAYFLQPSKKDSTVNKFTYKVKEGFIRTNKYRWDIIAMIDNDSDFENAHYTLKSYDKNRRQIGHLDFASWDSGDKFLVSGRVDCDKTLHIKIHERNQHRIFEIDKNGNNNMIEQRKIK